MMLFGIMFVTSQQQSVCTILKLMQKGRAVIDIADIDVSIKMSFDIHIDTEKRHIDIEKWYMYIV